MHILYNRKPVFSSCYLYSQKISSSHSEAVLIQYKLIWVNVKPFPYTWFKVIQKYQTDVCYKLLKCIKAPKYPLTKMTPKLQRSQDSS